MTIVRVFHSRRQAEFLHRINAFADGERVIGAATCLRYSAKAG